MRQTFHILVDAQENSTSFDTHDISAAERGKTLLREKLVKNEFTGVKIAWVDMKSNEYPLFYI